MTSPLEIAKNLIRRTASCYRGVFDRERRDVRIVLEDLAAFCRAHETTFHPDPRTHAILEGRREVWLRIQNYSRMTEDELLSLRLAALEAKKNPGI